MKARCCLVLVGLIATIRAEALPGGAGLNPLAANAAAAPLQTAAQAAEIQALLKRLTDQSRAAVQPEDLDQVVFDVQGYLDIHSGDRRINPDNMVLLEQLRCGLTFAKMWQNYLSDRKAGNAEGARETLNQLISGDGLISLIPRSQLLAASFAPVMPRPDDHEEPALKDIIDRVQTLDDLQPALNKLAALAPNDPKALYLAKCLLPMQEVYADLKSGLPTTENIDFLGKVDGPGFNAKLNTLLLNFVLQHYYDTYTGPAPAAEETPGGYTARVRDFALAHQDWLLLKKTVQVHAYIAREAVTGGMDMNAANDPTMGLNWMINGLNMEKSGQYELASMCYERALYSASTDIPADFIGQHLAAIHRDHPDEFEAGLKDFFFTPLEAPPFTSNPYMRAAVGMPGVVPGYGLPGNPMVGAFGRGTYPKIPAPESISPRLEIPGVPASTNAPTAPPPH